MTRSIAVALVLCSGICAAGARSNVSLSGNATNAERTTGALALPAVAGSSDAWNPNRFDRSESHARLLTQNTETTPGSNQPQTETQVTPQPDETQQRVIEAIETLGGRYELHDDAEEWSLRHVELNNTDATDDTLELLSTQHELRWLSLARTKVTETGLAHLASLKKLETLGLFETPINDDGLKTLAPLVSLKHIDLTGCPITGVGLEALTHLPLTMLEMNRTQLNDEGLAVVAKIPTLTHLFMQWTNITDAGLVHVAKLPRMQSLVLADTDVTDAGLQHLASLRDLRNLNLRGTAIRGPGLVYLTDLPSLGSLDLQRTAIGDEALRHLIPISSLLGVELDDTNVTLAGMREFWRVNPDIRLGDLEDVPPGNEELARRLLRDVVDEAITARRKALEKSSAQLEKQVMDALRRRDEKVKNYRFSWTQTQVNSRGTPDPDDDLVYPAECKLTVGGIHFASEYVGLRENMIFDDPAAAPELGPPLNVRVISRFDGKVDRTLWEYLDGERPPSASSRPGGRASNVHIGLAPMTWTYSTFDPAIVNLDWRNIDVLEQREVVDGRRCIVLRNVIRQRRHDYVQKYFLDPARDYVFVRYIGQRADEDPNVQVDIQYRQTETDGWLPFSWKSRWGLNETAAEVTRYELNPVVLYDDFQLKFPDGVQVN